MGGSMIRVEALHALAYCERLFFLQEVEGLSRPDAAMFAGRRLHQEVLADADDGSLVRLAFESETLGLTGVVDLVRRRDGQTIPYEHKRGRSAGKKGAREAWRTDRIQLGAYAMLVEEAEGQAITEGRIRYHADNITVRVAIDDMLRGEVIAAIARARELRESVERPPVSSNERLCVRCSLAPVCLPEEARLAGDSSFTPIRLLPPHPDGQTVHVIEQGAHVGRRNEQLLVRCRDESEEAIPIGDISQVVLHGFAQISTQAIRLCADRSIGVHWVTLAGGLIASLAPSAPTAQRHLRQFAALSDRSFALELARRLVSAKLESQLRYLLRSTRERERDSDVERAIASLREMLRKAVHADDNAQLLGFEGNGAAAYFSVLPALLADDLDPRMRFDGRSRRPPRDRVNTLLSYGYGMLYREALHAVVTVGLHPGVGFYHQPRSAAHTLALDIMELFRVPLVDMPIIGAINRRTFDPTDDFEELPGRVLLTESGRRKAIDILERRRSDVWKHNVVGYSMSYARIVELEVRLLEKEWLGEGGLFAKFRLR